MSTILAFAGSNSSTSINFKLVRYTTTLLEGYEVQLLDLARLPLPMYSQDHEKEHGFTKSLTELKHDIQKADGIVISVNEHNGNLSAYFKNLIDWLSRLDRDFIRNCKVMLMSTSPGKRGGIGAHEIAHKTLSRFGAEILSTFSLPSFHDNFDAAKGVTDNTLSKQHKNAIAAFLSNI